MNKIIAAAALAASIGLGSFSWAAPRTVKHAAASGKTSMRCPVTGNRVASMNKAAGHSTYKGKTYYFCCPMCKPRFDKNPAKYLRNAARGKFEKM